MGLFHRNKQPEIIDVEREETVNRTRLTKLVGNNQKLDEALSNFLLLDPERTISKLGDLDSFMSKGDAAKSRGDNLVACVNYEVAARIALCEQNKDGVVRCLILADEVRAKETHKTILANIDEGLRITKEYYGVRWNGKKTTTSDFPTIITIAPHAI
jgi:hypothetical protein